jgi:hypothetical protein
MGLIAGIIILVMGFAHIIYGETKQIPTLKRFTQDSVVVGSLRIMIFQGGILLLAVGILQILFSVGLIQLNGISVYIPVSIILLNTISSFMIMVIKHRDILKITIPQFLIFITVIVLQILSIS